ncbi:protein of unknown function [Taphrina deformans PYCC 5710]|uniref:CMP/dCMP-type deaminase domain-containing protein n=1 Tax=Taphrina deformans (strain PYCC 5710 / ATCC 11124 / CBS 356.35 / IMI 108563 / JCM 9778 / NBRC 8474) TaxID=1097556 RepID=R4XFD2_TAPDE|nr:protein of unknown function [Taphrina deformans PYCC 5710]|eukprot:CCG84378.1 protein of unknown function [Taphrina deformans PYCC 5710]
MDALLASAARYSAGLAIRSGISIAGGFAIRQVSTYISKVPQNLHVQELELISKRLDQKIKIVTPAIDLIEIIAARGNTTLNSTVQLTVSLRNDINAFGQRMADVMSEEPSPHTGSKEATRKVLDDMKSLLARIEDAVPLISLALTTSGANLSATLPDTVSPSRLLQASAFLQQADKQFDTKSLQEVQVGPSFSLKLYTIFEGHSRQSQDSNVTNITWQETYARSILEVIRMPMEADIKHDESYARDHKLNYLYHFRVTENLDDGRYHEELERSTYKRDSHGFIRGASRDIPVHNIARLFFSASGRLLNIDEARTPVLVLKINHGLRGPSAMVRAIHTGQIGAEALQPETDTSHVEESSPDDLEWIALELWADEQEEDSDLDNFDTASEASTTSQDDELVNPTGVSRPSTGGSSDVDDLAMQLQVLDMSKSTTISPDSGKLQGNVASLSLLEYILRLSALQTSEQDSILSISDERISLFLRDENSSSRSKTRQEADAIRRPSNDRFDTPASSVHYDEFIPGTQIKSRRTRRSRQTTPSSQSSTPVNLQLSRRTRSKPSEAQMTIKELHDSQQSFTVGPSSRQWRHMEDSPSNHVLTSSDSPLYTKKAVGKQRSNLFQASDDLQSKTNNGFSSRLRDSIEHTGAESTFKEANTSDTNSRVKTAGDDNYSSTQVRHREFMARAIQEAQKSIYIPSAFCVGCVVVKDGKIVSTGFSRELEGNTHAEQCALDKLSDISVAEGADMYTTMEPCSVRLSGNVPCVQRIIKAKIGAIYQGVKEPADFVECNGSDLLRGAGIEVHTVPGFEAQAIAIARGEVP